MLERLRAKPGGRAVPIAVGRHDVDARRGVVLARLPGLQHDHERHDPAGQVEVFRNAARHLRPGGLFLIECGIPDLRRLPYGETAVVFDRTDDHVGVDEYDVANQGLVSHHFTKRGARWEYGFGDFRYAWPAEMDLMAVLAGMRPVDRWEGWDRRPFTSDSPHHVSTWEKPD